MRALTDLVGGLAFFVSVVAFGLGYIGFPALYPISLGAGLLAALLGGRLALAAILLADGAYLLLWQAVNALQSLI